jgi:hypothetical protein
LVGLGRTKTPDDVHAPVSSDHLCGSRCVARRRANGNRDVKHFDGHAHLGHPAAGPRPTTETSITVWPGVTCAVYRAYVPLPATRTYGARWPRSWETCKDEFSLAFPENRRKRSKSGSQQCSWRPVSRQRYWQLPGRGPCALDGAYESLPAARMMRCSTVLFLGRHVQAIS